MAALILKNTTGAVIYVNGRSIAAGGQDDFSDDSIINLREDTTLTAAITSGDIVVNNGTTDLTDPVAGQRHVDNTDITDVEKDDALIVSDATIMNFEGNVTVVDDAGKATITIVPGGTLEFFQITGSDSALSEPMLFVTDTTRSSKVLSVEITNLDYAHDAPDNDSWFHPGNKHIDQSVNGYILPFDGTIIRMTIHSADVKSKDKNISVFINATETTSVVGVAGAGEQQDEATDLNIDFSAGDKLRIRSKNGVAGRMGETALAIWLKWRKV